MIRPCSPGREKHAVLSTPGVASVEELVVGFVTWRKPAGGIDGGAAGRLRHHHQQAPCPGTSSQGSIADLSAPVGRGRRLAPTSRSSASSRLGDRAEINGTQVTVNAVTRRHPLLHHAALRLHHARHRAHAARCRRPTSRPTRSCRSRPATTSRSVRKALARPACRTPRSSPTPSSASAASTTGCSRPAPARPSSPARCSASSSASSSSPRRSTPAPRTTSTSSPPCARSAPPPATSARSS